MLEVSGLSVAYGLHLAVQQAALRVGPGEVVVILGANGAGKSSLLRAVAGVVRTLPGAEIRLGDRDLGDLEPHEVVEAGIALVPEGRGIFGELTVAENLLLGAFPRRARAGERAALDRVLTLFPRLAERRHQTARTMSGGEQQMLAIGRALMSAPDILLLDEPSLGLSPIMCGELFETLRRVGEAGTGILLVEQNVRQSLMIADRGYLMENGCIVGEGSTAQLCDEAAVTRAFLGFEARPIGLAGPDTALTQAKADGRTEPPPTRRLAAAARTDTEDPDMNVNLLIRDKDMPATGGATFERHDPITGRVATRAAAASVADALAAADAAASAFPVWSAMGPNARRAKLMRAADLLESRVDGFVTHMTGEIGATAGWAHFNVHLAASMLREAAAMTTQITGEVIPSDRPGSVAMAFRQPVGVILSMAPWNAPVILAVRSVAMPLACGNTVVLKASEVCPATHRLVGEALCEAGLPPGTLNVVTNAPADAPRIVEALIGHEAVRRVNFTGSTRVGRIVAEAAARHLKRVLLELGGKAPLVVLDDADIDQAVAAAAFGAFANQGQICMSTERIVVDEDVADTFVRRFAEKAKALPAGDPRTGDVVLGSIVGEAAVERIDGLVKDAINKGARLVAGGTIDGTVMTATILDRVTPAMRIYSEESFGPVTTVVRVSGVDEAVRIANDTEYGLAAAVFGRDITRALAVAKRIESGICHINGPTVHDEAQMPFGGVKASGYGRFGGKAAIDEFTELRWITIQTEPVHYPF